MKRCADLDALQRIRDEAEQAWRDRDYPRVCRLLTSLGDQLSKVKNARLNYSRRATNLGAS